MEVQRLGIGGVAPHVVVPHLETQRADELSVRVDEMLFTRGDVFGEPAHEIPKGSHGPLLNALACEPAGGLFAYLHDGVQIIWLRLHEPKLGSPVDRVTPFHCPRVARPAFAGRDPTKRATP